MSSSGKKTSRTEQYVISYHPTAPTLGGSTYLRDRTIFFERVGHETTYRGSLPNATFGSGKKSH